MTTADVGQSAWAMTASSVAHCSRVVLFGV